MESEIVRRRINTLCSHFVPHDLTPPSSHLLPLNCSSNLSTSFRSHDNRMHYGRQSSASQGRFMRPAKSSTQQENLVDRPEFCSADCVKEANATTIEPPMYSRPGSKEPLFARPVQDHINFSYIDIPKSFVNQDEILPASECRAPTKMQEKEITCTRPRFSSQIDGRGWCPRINIIESKNNHVIAIELPGVDINDIRVEIDDKSLIVRGQRLMKWWKVTGCPKDSFTTYHRREISQGPFQVIWPLPPASDKNSISAEFVEGILHVTIPKL